MFYQREWKFEKEIDGCTIPKDGLSITTIPLHMHQYTIAQKYWMEISFRSSIR